MQYLATKKVFKSLIMLISRQKLHSSFHKLIIDYEIITAPVRLKHDIFKLGNKNSMSCCCSLERI